MAIVQMQKVAILAHSSLKEELISHLHEAGVVEVSEAKEPVAIDHTEVNFRAAELTFAISVLKGHASKQTLAAAQKPASVNDIIHAAQHTDVLGIVNELHKLEENDTNATRSIQELTAQKVLLSPWLKFSFSLDTPRETLTTMRAFGSIPEVKLNELSVQLAKEIPRATMEYTQTVKGLTYVCTLVWKEDADRFEEIATSLGWTDVDLPSLEGTPSTLYEDASAEIKKLKRQKEKSTKERVHLSVEMPNLIKAQRLLRWLDEKQSVREAMAETQSTITLLGWMPKNEMARLENKIQKTSPAVALLRVKPDEGEEPPVLLKNLKFITPFQSVTNLYGLPLPSEDDPTPLLAPFFILYFALCLTDAGYGLVLAAIFGTVVWKRKRKIEESPLLWLLFLSGIVTFFVSIPFGGWLGFDPAAVAKFAPVLTKQTAEGTILFKGQIWNLSTQSGVNFLQNLSLVLGLTHLFFGMFLAGWHKWVHGKKAAALCQDFTSHLLLGATIFLVVAPEHLKDIATYVLYASIAIALWGKGYGSPWYLRPLFGAIGMLNFTIGLLSNGLSYLRILALGLVTGAIAMAINQVAVEMGKLFPIWMAIPVIVVIFLLGHLVSIALNTLGSFIHSGRLQFIEFFSQFFEGGGKGFTPFRRSISL